MSPAPGPRWIWLGAAALFVGGVASGGGASFVGAETCKLCHRDIYESWAKTPHRRASDAVPSSMASGSCLGCHATSGRELSGVQCESCHGAGSAYSAPEVMIDVEKAVMAGLVLPAMDVCARCHENDEPGHRGEFVPPDPAALALSIHVLKRD